MTMRQDTGTDDWPLRPWIMAAICAVAGLLFNQLADFSYNEVATPLRQAGATFVAVAALAFVMTVEQRRWTWSLAFALGWGAVIALVGWFTASYNQQGEIAEWPYLSGLFAVLIAAPLFQTVRDEGAWRFPYAKLHGHAWTDAVIGAAGLVFTGISFLLAWLIAGLFDLIGIELIKKLLQKDWFGWMLAGFAFGTAVGLLRERDGLVATLQRLVMVVLGVLAPVLAAALIAFLASLPFTGLGKLWESDVPATPLMLLAGAGAILLANAVFGNGDDDRVTSRILRLASLALVLCVLPLAIIAAVSLGARIDQYGWTPERMWGVVAVAIAIGYGLAGWWSAYKGREQFDGQLRPLQIKMAIGLCGIALFLALPILDFGAISARSQLDRLHRGQVKAEEFDWKAMAFDFGPKGREHLSGIAESGAANMRDLAKAALASDNRYELGRVTESVAQQSRLSQNLRVLDDIFLSEELKAELTGHQGCNDKPCALLALGEDRLVLVHTPYGDSPQSRIIDLKKLNKPEQPADGAVPRVEAPAGPPTVQKADLSRAKIEIRSIERRQLYVDGKPVGDPFE